MDAMALLCNLQADGPTTLRKLQEIGCSTLDDLERVPVFELADALGSDAGFAQRFVREARSLRQRFGAGEPEPEEARVPLPGSARLAAARAGREAPALEAEPHGSPGAPRMLRPAPRETPMPAALPIVNRPLKSLSSRPPGTPLRSGLVEGLNAEWCKALIGQGILTLETLIDAPGLALARALGRSYTELMDLQCFAKRFLAQRGASITLERDGAHEPEVLRPAERPAAAATPPVPTKRPGLRPMSHPDYTIFPPRHEATETRERVERETPAQTTSDPRRVGQDAGIGGPFA